MNIYSWLIILILFIIIIIRYHLKRLNLYKCSYVLPGPKAWPIIGNALWCLGSSEDILKKCFILTQKYDSPFRFWLGSKLLVFITKPKDLEIVLNNCVQKEESVMKFLRPLIGNGLITAQSLEWRLHRKIINPTFNQKILNNFIPVFIEHTKTLLQKLEQKVGQKEFDIYKYISLNTLDFVCDTTMGIEMNAQIQQLDYADSLCRALNTAFVRMSQTWNRIDSIFYRLPVGKQFLNDLKVVHDFAKKVLNIKREEYITDRKNSKDDTIKRKPFLEYLLDLKEANNDFSEAQIFDEINTFIAAGTDTLSSMISFTCMLLGSHPQIQEQVYKEVSSALKSSKDVLFNLDKLQYLERVIKETMRLFPATPLLIRKTVKPIQLESCLLPKDTAILYMILHTHRDENIWANPLKFDPERFLPENIRQKHSFSYLPFGAGLRQCIGMRYAMLAMKVVLAMLIKNYRFKSNFDIETLRLESNIVLRPVLGHLVQIEKR